MPDRRTIIGRLTQLADRLDEDETYGAMLVAEDVRAAVELLNADQAVVKAWTDEGSNPAYHRMWKERLRSDWPVLAKALDGLVER